MNLEFIINKYGNIDITDEILEQIEELAKPRSVWEIGDGYRYWFVDNSSCPHDDVWSDYWSKHGDRRAMGGVFLTQEDCEEEIERRLAETLLLKYGGRRRYDKNKENWYLAYNKKEKRIEAVQDEGFLSAGVIYFNTSDKALDACEKIGEQRVINALFYDIDREEKK